MASAALLSQSVETAVGDVRAGASTPSRHERQLQVLAELAEIGLEIARVIERRVKDADPATPIADLQALATAFDRVAHAGRQSALLQARLTKDFDQQARQEAHWAAFHANQDRQQQAQTRKVRVERIVEDVARSQCGADQDRLERIMVEACERLDQEDYGDILSRPVSEIIAHICRDLGLDPDWAQLGEQAWAQDEIQSGAVGRPLAETSAETRPLPLAGEGDPEGVERAFRRDTG